MLRLKILFWNINKKDLSEPLINICKIYDIDIIILAESNINTRKLILNLNQDNNTYYLPDPSSQCKKIVIISKYDYGFFPILYEGGRFSIRKLKLPFIKELLIMTLHIPDKRSFSHEDQYEECEVMINHLETYEEQHSNTNSIVIGDFNMNPFEHGIIKAKAFSAVMSSHIASKVRRKVQGNYYNYFYNPMWNLFGDINNKVEGTYFYYQNNHIAYFWNTYDQVLIRPSLINNFDKKSLKIIKNDGKNNFLTKNKIPDKRNYSDHLPITFSLNF